MKEKPCSLVKEVAIDTLECATIIAGGAIMLGVIVLPVPHLPHIVHHFLGNVIDDIEHLK